MKHPWPQRGDLSNRSTPFSFGWAAWSLLVISTLVPRSLAGALEDYVGRADDQFSWKQVEQSAADGMTVTHLEMVSQQWREHVWTHHLQVVRPDVVRHPDIALLYITGDGRGTRQLPTLKLLAERVGAVAVVVTQVPNQPLYDGRKEDALIAYTFEKYAQTGDASWPLLLPMVKSAVKAMDAVQAFLSETQPQQIKRFVVTGASKRGWTTWLTGAVDPRVAAIAPMVIDILNMKIQLDWSAKVYGKQSKQIDDYTRLNLHLRLDEPRIVALRELVDPFSYRARYTMPKLILLGTNDPYWTVDALRHYWSDLPEPKLIFQTPNAGHDLAGGKEAVQTLAAFFGMIAAGEALPQMRWSMGTAADGGVALGVIVNRAASRIRLWTAESADRDFRDEKWTPSNLEILSGSSRAETVVDKPKEGYRAFLAEITLQDKSGHEYRLSTEARVTPDTVK